MRTELSRRALLAGMAASVGSGAVAKAPISTERPLARGETRVVEAGPPETGRIVERSGLGGVVTYALLDAETGEMLDGRQFGRAMPPASTLKSVTAIYAKSRLGGTFRFNTELIATGPVEGGKLNGDLVLVGGGDPTLDTDRLADLGIALREAGVTEVAGRFLVYGEALPRGDRIDSEQPEHVGYNPSFCGLNLNYNRVHFEWKPRDDAFDITMQARGVRFQPATKVARMAIVDRQSPVFEYRRGDGVDRWSVAKWALGKNDGARWLPVRFPALYTGDVFRTLARSNGVILKAPQIVATVPDGTLLATTESDPLTDVLRGMMKYSTNLTAEAAGLAASMANGVPVTNLIGSGSRMAGWAQTNFGVRNLTLRDHSGLGYASDISAEAMSQILRQNADVASLMTPVRVPDPARSDGQPMAGVNAVGKTGTLNFVSTLTGFLTAKSGRKAVYTIFTADTSRRDAIPPEQRERPRGARSWSRRSRGLQRALLAEWAGRLSVT